MISVALFAIEIILSMIYLRSLTDVMITLEPSKTEFIKSGSNIIVGIVIVFLVLEAYIFFILYALFVKFREERKRRQTNERFQRA
jgi:heme/copper-type cytochrome/quinol oxidase subunit 2